MRRNGRTSPSKLTHLIFYRIEALLSRVLPKKQKKNRAKQRFFRFLSPSSFFCSFSLLHQTASPRFLSHFFHSIFVYSLPFIVLHFRHCMVISGTFLRKAPAPSPFILCFFIMKRTIFSVFCELYTIKQAKLF